MVHHDPNIDAIRDAECDIPVSLGTIRDNIDLLEDRIVLLYGNTKQNYINSITVVDEFRAFGRPDSIHSQKVLGAPRCLQQYHLGMYGNIMSDVP